MREQTELTFKIGFPIKTNKDAVISFERGIVEAAALICGGCETMLSKGWWTEDGASCSPFFTGKLDTEATLTLRVSCETVKSRMAYVHIKKAIVYYAARYSIETDWVHVQNTPFTGMHFSVEDTKLSASEIRDVVSPGTRFSHK